VLNLAEASCREGTDRARGLRIQKRQGMLFANGAARLLLAIVINDRSTDGAALIRWHYQKAGHIEIVHHVLNNGVVGSALSPIPAKLISHARQLFARAARVLSDRCELLLARRRLREAWHAVRQATRTTLPTPSVVAAPGSQSNASQQHRASNTKQWRGRRREAVAGRAEH
jgi:hypothetical protein